MPQVGQDDLKLEGLASECILPTHPPPPRYEDKVNANPTVYSPVVLARPDTVYDGDDDDAPEPIDELEVFEMIRHINDPEHPLTLEQLNVAMVSLIHVDNAKSTGAWRSGRLRSSEY